MNLLWDRDGVSRLAGWQGVGLGVVMFAALAGRDPDGLLLGDGLIVSNRGHHGWRDIEASGNTSHCET